MSELRTTSLGGPAAATPPRTSHAATTPAGMGQGRIYAFHSVVARDFTSFFSAAGLPLLARAAASGRTRLLVLVRLRRCEGNLSAVAAVRAGSGCPRDQRPTLRRPGTGGRAVAR